MEISGVPLCQAEILTKYSDNPASYVAFALLIIKCIIFIKDNLNQLAFPIWRINLAIFKLIRVSIFSFSFNVVANIYLMGGKIKRTEIKKYIDELKARPFCCLRTAALCGLRSSSLISRCSSRPSSAAALLDFLQ